MLISKTSFSGDYHKISFSYKKNPGFPVWLVVASARWSKLASRELCFCELALGHGAVPVHAVYVHGITVHIDISILLHCVMNGRIQKIYCSLHFKMLEKVDFFSKYLTVRLIKKICEICKTICVYESIFKNKSNDMKKINNYLIFLNKTNGQIRT